MSKIITSKRGGPYSKKEQQDRRDKVSEMYYAKGMSIQEISKELKVNRNTISEDLKVIRRATASKYEVETVQDHFIEQIEALRAQKNRLTKALDGAELKDALKAEKAITELSLKIATLSSEITVTKKEEIPEVEFAKILREMYLSPENDLPHLCSKLRIQKAVIVITRGSKKKAEQFWERLEKMGIEHFEQEVMRGHYYLLDFALVMEFITKAEYQKIMQEFNDLNERDAKRHKEVLKKYEAKYGTDDTKWPPGIYNEMCIEIES